MQASIKQERTSTAHAPSRTQHPHTAPAHSTAEEVSLGGGTTHR